MRFEEAYSGWDAVLLKAPVDEVLNLTDGYHSCHTKVGKII